MLFGYTTKFVHTDRQTRLWDKESFFADTKEKCKPEVADTIVRLYEFTKNHGDEISWGRGTTYGSFTFRKLKQETPVSIFAVTSTGAGWICFGELVGKGVKENILEAFRVKLNEIPGVTIPQEAVSFAKFPSIAVNTLNGTDTLKHFKETVLALCQQIES